MIKCSQVQDQINTDARIISYWISYLTDEEQEELLLSDYDDDENQKVLKDNSPLIDAHIAETFWKYKKKTIDIISLKTLIENMNSFMEEICWEKVPLEKLCLVDERNQNTWNFWRLELKKLMLNEHGEPSMNQEIKAGTYWKSYAS